MRLTELLSRHGIRASLSIAVMVLLLMHVSGVLQFGFVKRLENFTYDLRLNLMMPSTQDDRIVIVDIDEKSWQRLSISCLMTTKSKSWAST
jgi:adenylate cyclase